MCDLTQGSSKPSADPSIDLASHFSGVDDAPSKSKLKRGDTPKGKDVQLKIGDHTEDQEVLVPISRLQLDKKREHGQMRVLDSRSCPGQDDRATRESTRCSKNPKHSVAWRSGAVLDLIGAAYRRGLSTNRKGVYECPFETAKMVSAISC